MRDATGPRTLAPGDDGCWAAGDLALGVPDLRLRGGVLVEERRGMAGYAICDAWKLFDLVTAVLVKGSHRLTGRDCRTIRSHLNLSQPDLARVLGTSRSSVARWEASKLLASLRSLEGDELAAAGDAWDAAVSAPLPRWADRALRSYAGARLGLAGMALRLEAKDGKAALPRRLVLQHVVGPGDADGEGRWELAENNFGPGGTGLADPLAGRRVVAALKAGDCYGGRRPKKALAWFEGRDLGDVLAQARAAVAAMPRPPRHWFVADYMDLPLAGPGYDLGNRRVDRIREKLRASAEHAADEGLRPLAADASAEAERLVEGIEVDLDAPTEAATGQ